eukprot:CAMPEP_0194509332 /NCGR_PEP_ID=MMETSP0253-20130528/40029_1 /TAXON_ID=2966 /ORGANISM="Noctiluca scintillans" /LENGTH=44 /DNA_ID= /DNA_START= /DNA_END= /DNA_ORIENTATION=
MMMSARDTDGIASLSAVTDGQALKLIFRRVRVSGPKLCAQALRY